MNDYIIHFSVNLESLGYIDAYSKEEAEDRIIGKLKDMGLQEFIMKYGFDITVSINQTEKLNHQPNE